MVEQIEDVLVPAFAATQAEDGPDPPRLPKANEAGRTPGDVERSAHGTGKSVKFRVLQGKFDGSVASHRNSSDTAMLPVSQGGESGFDILRKIEGDCVFPSGMAAMFGIGVVRVIRIWRYNNETLRGGKFHDVAVLLHVNSTTVCSVKEVENGKAFAGCNLGNDGAITEQASETGAGRADVGDGDVTRV